MTGSLALSAASPPHEFSGPGRTVPAEGTLLLRGEEEAAAVRWIDRYVVSPLHAALVHVAENVGLLAGADLVAGRIYETINGRPCAYVGTPGLGLAPRQRARLQVWPLSEDSLFARLPRLGVVDRPIGAAEMCRAGREVGGDAVAAGVDPALHLLCRMSDGFVVTLPVEHQCWAALLLVRGWQRPPFEHRHRDLVMARRPALCHALRRGLAEQHPSPPDAAARHDRLSRTERDVLALLCQGKTERQVAEALDRSPHTVHVHVKNIYRKLGVHSREQLQRTMQAMAQRLPDAVVTGE